MTSVDHINDWHNTATSAHERDGIFEKRCKLGEEGRYADAPGAGFGHA